MNVLEYLDQSNVQYAISEHAPTYSAQVMAAEEHEKGQYVAKPVIVKSEGRYIMCVLAAPDKVIFDKLREYLGTEDVMLAPEEEVLRGVSRLRRGGRAAVRQALWLADDHG